jgi:tetratricopeptide (TPR) repeat protein
MATPGKPSALLLAAIALLPPLAGCGAAASDEQAAIAYARGDWTTAESRARTALKRDPNNARAKLVLARSLARKGEYGPAREVYVAVAADLLQADDLLQIGRILLARGRPALGWAALDAALKLDPKHRESLSEKSLRYGSLDQVPGAAASADLLTAVASGPALAELVIGLLKDANPADTQPGDDPLFKRIVDRDRATFVRVTNPAAARKLLARLLLEDGRPAEARALLDTLDDRATDPETNWLYSRAFLDEGQIEQADKHVQLAGKFGHDTPMSREPCQYVGAKKCAECHAAIYRSQQSSHHAETVGWGSALKTVPLPKGPVVDPTEPKVVHRYIREGEKITAEADVDGKTIRAIIAYVLGSGGHGQTMIGRDEEGHSLSMRISYYTGGDAWDITSGFNPHPANPLQFVGEAINEESFRDCLNCHTTRFRSETDRSGPEAADKGIGCERCHGPGENHIKAVDAGFPQLAIARPKISTPSARLALCGQCHSADGKTPPTDARFIRFQSATLPLSRCVTESGGKLDCVSCHNPHRNLETDPAHYEARCLACHGPAGKPNTTTEVVRLDPVPAAPCPVNPTKNCLKCHMPKVEGAMLFTAFTDHHIRVHREQEKEAQTGGETAQARALDLSQRGSGESAGGVGLVTACVGRRAGTTSTKRRARKATARCLPFAGVHEHNSTFVSEILSSNNLEAGGLGYVAVPVRGVTLGDVILDPLVDLVDALVILGQIVELLPVLEMLLDLGQERIEVNFAVGRGEP